MKILQVISSLETGGAEKFVVQLVPALRTLGIDTRLLVIDRQRTLFHDELEAAGVLDTDTLGMRNYYNPWAMVRMLSRLRGYDIVHSHLFPTQYWVAAAAALASADTPLVTTEHNTSNRRRSIRLFHRLDRRVYQRYKAVVSVSAEARAKLDWYVRGGSTRMLTIPNGIDLRPFEGVAPAELGELPGYDPADCHVVQVSSFTAQKDHTTLIHALADCPPHLKLLLIGDGPKKNEMQALALHLGVAERIHFLGICGNVPAWLQAADIAVMSSHFEGMSLSVLEAFASGTPFVGSNSPGLGALAAQGGLSVPARDAQALASTLTRLAHNPGERTELARRGRLVAREHGITRTANQYRDLYEQLHQGGSSDTMGGLADMPDKLAL